MLTNHHNRRMAAAISVDERFNTEAATVHAKYRRGLLTRDDAILKLIEVACEVGHHAKVEQLVDAWVVLNDLLSGCTPVG